MMRRKNKKIQVYGKGTAPPVLSKGCRDLTRPSRDPIKRPAGRPVSFTTPVPLAVISNPSQSTAKLAQYARYRKSHEGLAPPGRFPLVNSTPLVSVRFTPLGSRASTPQRAEAPVNVHAPGLLHVSPVVTGASASVGALFRMMLPPSYSVHANGCATSKYLMASWSAVRVPSACKPKRVNLKRCTGRIAFWGQ